MSDISYTLAFFGGILSFLSPCILPLIPSYVSFITGVSLDEFKTGNKAFIRKLTAINSLLFITGFSTVFILLGVFSSFMSALLYASFMGIRLYHVGGVIIIVFGLYVMGILKIGFLSKEHRVHLKSKPRGYIGSFVVGLTFGAGWTPCIGPMLGSILFIAATAGSAFYGFKLLLVYSIGLGIPFLATSLAMNTFLSRYTAIQKHMRVIMFLSGLLLIAFGILLLTDSVTLLLKYAPDLGVDHIISSFPEAE
ncbi:MAG: sulfite exporter TauE/SafE family protein [Thermodesulfovibrionia bacterium]|nr:sulfite exporter TauE/SafE family protein [Thermodesulfovibrionia bacterium]